VERVEGMVVVLRRKRWGAEQTSVLIKDVASKHALISKGVVG
jgi:hypothetical protein